MRSSSVRRTGIRAAVTPRVLLACAVSLALLDPPPVHAQEPPDSADRPFVAGGIYDKPYLATLLGRTAIGGYAEAHARFERVDGVTEELGFTARRFNLFTATRVSDFVRIAAELEVEERGEEITLELAAIDVVFHPAATLRAGMILTPLGRFNLAHDSPQNDFTERPLVSTEILGVALSEAGVGFLGALPVGGGLRLTYELYGVNGFDDGILRGSSDGTRLPAGAASLEDDNASPSVVGRIALSPEPGREIGLSAHHGAYNVFNADGLELDARRDLTILVADVEVEAGGVRIRGEGVVASLDLPPSLDGVFAARQRGFYVEALRDFGHGWIGTAPSSVFSVGARADAVDFDAHRTGDSVERLSFVLNFRPTPDTALKLDYLRGRAFDRFNNRSDHAGVRFSVATYF